MRARGPRGRPDGPSNRTSRSPADRAEPGALGERSAELEKERTKKLPGAKLAGALPLLEAKAEQGKESASFQVVSAVLSSTGEGGFTRSLITSGHAPLTPGSRAAVAATLDPKGATLLWDSLNGATSAVSGSLSA